MTDLQPGVYKVTISAAAFSPRTANDATIASNNIVRLDVALSVTQINESITVGGGAVTLQTDRADVNNQLRSEQITNLPLINSQGRNFQSLYKILPGFTPPTEAHS